MITSGLLNSKAVLHCNDFEYYNVKESSIQGKGLFCERNVSVGSVLFFMKGEDRSHSYSQELAMQNPNWIGTGYEQWIQLAPDEIGLYINHSCSPNVIINEDLAVIAIAPLKKNDELLLDYSTTELDPFWQMHCCCNTYHCRKTIRAYQFLPFDLKQKYMPYINPVFSTIGEEMITQKPKP